MQSRIDITKPLTELLDKALSNELSSLFDEAVEKFNKRKHEVIASILLSVHREVDIQTMKDSVVFTVREVKK